MYFEDKILQEVRNYIDNPNTYVWINYNDEAGLWQYSVQVEGTDFWLNSFATEIEAKQYIQDNNLKMMQIEDIL
jgi:hypothetical protein